MFWRLSIPFYWDFPLKPKIWCLWFADSSTSFNSLLLGFSVETLRKIEALLGKLLETFNSLLLGFSVETSPKERCRSMVIAETVFQFPFIGIFRWNLLMRKGTICNCVSTFNSLLLGFSVETLSANLKRSTRSKPFNSLLLGFSVETWFWRFKRLVRHGYSFNSLLLGFSVETRVCCLSEQEKSKSFQFPFIGIFRWNYLESIGVKIIEAFQFPFIGIFRWNRADRFWRVKAKS